MELFTYGILFLMGIFFGSFFTLAVYRIPKGEDILYTHSYCPNCHHKLGVLDLIPVFSYLFLGGKCRYCHEKVRIRYLLLEILSGIVFVLYGYSTRFHILFADTTIIISFFFTVLYLVGLFILAGIDKERREIPYSVLWYEISVVIGYMIYICTLNQTNAYIYIIYLSILILIILLDTVCLRKYGKPCYGTSILMLVMAMLIFSGVKVMLGTIGALGIYLLMYNLRKVRQQRKYRFRKEDNPKRIKIPFGFILSISNIFFILLVNWMEQYMLV